MTPADTVLYTCPVCISAFRLERTADDPVPGILTCPLCGSSSVRVDPRERKMIEKAYTLQICVRDIISKRAREREA